jgi:hypothetical protein
MARCKVVSKPDYELTLSSEEKETLQTVLGMQTPQPCMSSCLTEEQYPIILRIHQALKKY